jgi:hypothetical protein
MIPSGILQKKKSVLYERVSTWMTFTRCILSFAFSQKIRVFQENIRGFISFRSCNHSRAIDACSSSSTEKKKCLCCRERKKERNREREREREIKQLDNEKTKFLMNIYIFLVDFNGLF